MLVKDVMSHRLSVTPEWPVSTEQVCVPLSFGGLCVLVRGSRNTLKIAGERWKNKKKNCIN